MPDIDPAAIVHALREMHAAENSYNRALAEWQASLPTGLRVLHRRPGTPDSPDTVYWSHEKTADGRAVYGVDQGDDEGMKAIIVEAPGPRDEFLPRLEDCPTGVVEWYEAALTGTVSRIAAAPETTRAEIDALCRRISCCEQGAGAELRRLKDFLGGSLPADWEDRRFQAIVSP